MKCIVGDIWNLADSHWIVVPANCGWSRTGANIMGRGMALQAAARFPDLPREYGAICRVRPDALHVMPVYRLILFPVKPLILSSPQLSWNQDADIGLITRSAETLAAWLDGAGSGARVAMPLVGCGNGRLDPADVVPILESYFDRFDNVILVTER